MLEEERRLFYVGITRAEQKLYLTHAEERRRNGEFMPSKASSFLVAIPEDMLEQRKTIKVRSSGRSFMQSLGGGSQWGNSRRRPGLMDQELRSAVVDDDAGFPPSAAVRRPGPPVTRAAVIRRGRGVAGRRRHRRRRAREASQVRQRRDRRARGRGSRPQGEDRLRRRGDRPQDARRRAGQPRTGHRLVAVTIDDVRHIAALARLGLTDERAAALVEEMNTILGHMDVLAKVDTDGRRGGVGVGAGGLPVRADSGPPIPLARSLDAFAPSVRDGFLLVPRLSHARHGGGVVSVATTLAPRPARTHAARRRRARATRSTPRSRARARSTRAART